MNKKTIINAILLSVILCLSGNTAFSQLKVVNNKVAIGETYGQAPNGNLDVRGTSYFDCAPAPCGFSFTTTISANAPVATLLPQWSNSVRIGAPNQQLYQLYTQNLYVNGVYVTSDIKTKENIRPLGKTLDKINNLNIVEFDYKDDYFLKKSESSPFLNEVKRTQKNNTGFLAQDIEKIYPNLVQYNKDEDLLRINYLGLIPELTKAVQELSSEVEKLKSEINYLKSNCCNDNFSNNKSDNVIDNKEAILYQNRPNPFTNNTTISFFIPKSVKVADLYIYNLNGVQIKHSLITSRELGSFEVNGNDLGAGMYIYTLVTDNNIIDSKRMILTK